MRGSHFAVALLCGVALGAPAFAQAPASPPPDAAAPPAPPAPAAPPEQPAPAPAAPDTSGAPAATGSGSSPGDTSSTGDSTAAKPPMHHKMASGASNISGSTTRGEIAPRLPAPKLGPDASAADYLAAAKQALAKHRTGEAQESLEMAETRALDRSTPADQSGTPDSSPMVASIHAALAALGAKDMAGANSAIDQAMGGAATSSSSMSGHTHMHHKMAHPADGSTAAPPAQ